MAEEMNPKDLPGKLLNDLALDPGKLVKDMSLDQVRKLIEAAFKQLLPDVMGRALEKVGYTEEIAGLVQLLAARSNDSKEEALHKALTLYGLALDAREKGNRLAILSPDDVIVHDIIGFEAASSAR
jgi:hypothetical protein